LIDFSAFLDGSPPTKLATAQSISHAFKTSGFLYLQNHGIPPESISTVFHGSAEFFKRPQHEKDSLCWTTPESNRGYVMPGREKVTQSSDPEEIAKLRASNPDLKESMEIGRDGVPGQPNQWPDQLDAQGEEFTKTMKAFFDMCKDLHIKVMRAIALGIGLDEHFFDSFTDGGDNTLRLLHYPPVLKSVFKDKPGQVRAGEHSDYGSITLLFQDNVGGLEVKSPRGTFVRARPIQNTIVVNAGDLLSRWSNDEIKSTKHRVVQPPATPGDESEAYPARYSVAYFCNPNFDRYIEALPNTWEQTGKKYDGINSGDYLVQRLAATY
jgi:isopenicillin N synthase-like dioxygenase